MTGAGVLHCKKVLDEEGGRIGGGRPCQRPRGITDQGDKEVPGWVMTFNDWARGQYVGTDSCQ